MRWTGRRVADALGVPFARPELAFCGIATDTRRLAHGAVFVALEGERFDGHRFLDEARSRGAAAAVVRRGTAAVAGLPFFEVEDPREALGRLARARRDALPPGTAVVAVTGTNGKTSTKELVAAVLRTRLRVHATTANENNLVGVPQTVLAAPDETQAMVVEVGTNQPGEIARLRDIVAPTIGVVTNVGVGHLAGLGTLEGVLVEKLSLLPGVTLAVVGAEPRELADGARALARTVVAGLGPSAEVRPRRWEVAADGRASFELNGVSGTLPLLGAHQLANAMLAVAVGDELWVPRREAVRALETVRGLGRRVEFRQVGEFTILDDCYNANPESLRAALGTFEAISTGRRRVVVVGTMLEIGPATVAWHAAMAREIAETRPDVIAAVGEFVPAFRDLAADLEAELVTAPDAATLGPALRRRLRGDEAILLKASRGVALEQVLDHLTS